MCHVKCTRCAQTNQKRPRNNKNQPRMPQTALCRRRQSENSRQARQWHPTYQRGKAPLAILIIGALIITWSACGSASARSLLDESGAGFVANPGAEISIFANHEAHQTRHHHANVVNELLARITNALSAVGGDDQALTPSGESLFASSATAATGDSQPSMTTAASSANTSKASTTQANAAHEEREIEEPSGEPSDDISCAEPDCSDLLNPDKKNMTDTERLVALQDWLQAGIKSRLKETARSGMEMFDKLSLTGGCTASLLNLMANLGEIKSFAFKFLDASAKIPSGMMYGLLSDFGDFDECLSIRASANVAPQDEEAEGTFSGKYCLLNVRLNYHLKLGPNVTVPEGIYEDGVLWDELVRNYWTSNMNKGFQVGVCVPSRCNNDDLEQIFRAVAESNNVLGEVLSCQDGNDLRRQTTPDCLQQFILTLFALIMILNLIGSALERYGEPRSTLAYRMLVCFSLARNWQMFMRQTRAPAAAFNFKFVKSQHLSARAATAAAAAALASSTATGCRLLNAARQQMQRKQYSSALISGSSLDEASSSSSSLAGPIASGATAPSSQTQIATHPDGQAPLDQTTRADDDDGVADEHTIMQADDQSYQQTQNEEQANEVKAQQRIGSAADAPLADSLLSHLSGLKLLVIIWITIGHSFLYPSANNYQYYRSIINMKMTRDSVWFAATNFTLGIDTLLYMTGLVFVYKLASVRRNILGQNCAALEVLPISTTLQDDKGKSASSCSVILHDFAAKILRFWPTYLTVIAIAIVVPLIGDGPMWPEMVSRRLGDSCRKNWWANLLIMNNLFDQQDICLPSSWFVSVLMQLFLLGSLIMLVVRKYSVQLAVCLIGALLAISSSVSFAFAYLVELKAPVIRMDESFILELDNNIFRLYTNVFSNMGPFLIGMLGGLYLIRWQIKQQKSSQAKKPSQDEMKETSLDELACEPCLSSGSVETKSNCTKSKFRETFDLKKMSLQIIIALLVCTIAVAVLSSVFYNNYSKLSSSIYWSFHRIGWAIASGYLIHQCAVGRFRLLKDLLSLSHLIPFSRLIFIAYLVFPIFIYMHSGFVRDGLHVSIYNMMNIYITRLVFTFATALFVHLMVELPCCSIESILLEQWMNRSCDYCKKLAPTGKEQKSQLNDTLYESLSQTVTIDLKATGKITN